MGYIFFAIVLIVLAWYLNRFRLRAQVNLANKTSSNRWHAFLCWGKLVTPKDILSFCTENSIKYGPNCIAWLGPLPIFLSSEPEILKEIFYSKNCLNKPDIFYSGISLKAGQGLISEPEPAWSLHRKLLNKAFSPKMLNSWLSVFDKGIISSIQQIGKSIEKGEKVEMLWAFRLLTLKNASQTVLKRNMDLSNFDSIKMAYNFQSVMEYISKLCMVNPLKISLLRKIADISVFKHVNGHIKYYQSYIDESMGVVERNDTTDPSLMPNVNSVLDILYSGQKKDLITAKDITEEVNHLFAGSFETTSTTLFLILVLLAMHPEYQERVYEEIISVLPDDDTEITIEDLNKMVYLEMVFNEALRVFPTVPIVLREVSNEDVSLSNGLTLPVGQIILIDLFRLHRKKEIWGPDADKFNPENFLPSNVATRHPFSFIPFTKGHRFCIGWKYAILFSKISLARIIKAYKISTDFKFEDLRIEFQVVLKLEKDPQLRMEPRTQTTKINGG